MGMPEERGILLCSLLGVSGGTTGAGEADGNLEGIVDEPLEGGEGTDHEDTETETTPDARGAELGEDGTNTRGGLILVELGDDGVSGVRDDGAEDTSDVTGGGSDGELLDLVALSTRLRNDMLVNGLNSALEGPELHHGVRHLTTPEGSQALVESSHTLLREDAGHSLAKCGGEGALLGVGGLDANLNGLPGAQGYVGNDLSRGGSSEPQEILVGAGILGAGSLHEGVLQDLIETKLEETLHRVSNQSGSPSEGKATNTILGSDLTEGSLDSDLLTALDQIYRGHKGVGKTARQNTSQTAVRIVLVGVELKFLLLSSHLCL